MHLRAWIVGLAALAMSASMWAQENEGGPAEPRLTHEETITVTAAGEVRTEQTVNTSSLAEAAPGTSPIRVVSQLPSVNYTSADPYGSYEWAVRISARGFNQNQMGFTLDEVPLGDMTYSNWNGLHISRAAISENLGRVVMSQGTGALETASNSNLGGTLEFFTKDPEDKLGFSVDQSFGSFNSYRTVGRFDSGLLGGKTKFSLVGVNQLSDKWRGHGNVSQNYYQFNGKVQHFFNKGVLTGYVDYSYRHEVDYQDVSKEYVKYLGYNWDNYGNWNNSLQAAFACNGLTSYPGAVANLPSADDPCDAGYFAGAGLRRDVLGYVNYKTQLNDKLSWKTTIYGHGNDGAGLWFAPSAEFGTSFYNETMALTGSPIAMRTTEYGIQRGGFLSSVNYETSRNRLEGGFWYERENYTVARRFYSTGLTAPLQTLDNFPKNPFYTQWAYDYTSNVIQGHVQDQYKATNALTLSAGFKTEYTLLDGKLDNCDPGNCAQGSLNAGKPVLPQFGANYKIDEHNELYGDAAYNVRTFVAGAQGVNASPWNIKLQGNFDLLKKTLKPETSWTEEFGYRYTNKYVTAEANYFHVNFNNRLLAIGISGISGAVQALSNVGGVTTDGMDVAANVKLGDSGLSLYNGFTYTNSTYDDDVASEAAAGVYFKGKQSVDTPKTMWKSELAYKNKNGLAAHINADYMSTRYYSFDNTGSVDGRVLADLGASYECTSDSVLKGLKLQLNVYNLLDEHYYSSIGTNGFAASDTAGTSQTLQVGSPRTVVGTLSMRF